MYYFIKIGVLNVQRCNIEKSECMSIIIIRDFHLHSEYVNQHLYVNKIDLILIYTIIIK